MVKWRLGMLRETHCHKNEERMKFWGESQSQQIRSRNEWFTRTKPLRWRNWKRIWRSKQRLMKTSFEGPMVRRRGDIDV